MTVITKHIEIKENRRLRLNLNLPDSFPTGQAELRLTIHPICPVPAVVSRKPFEGLFGALKGKNVYNGDGVELQRQWRDEWPE